MNDKIGFETMHSYVKLAAALTLSAFATGVYATPAEYIYSGSAFMSDDPEVSYLHEGPGPSGEPTHWVSTATPSDFTVRDSDGNGLDRGDKIDLTGTSFVLSTDKTGTEVVGTLEITGGKLNLKGSGKTTTSFGTGWRLAGELDYTVTSGTEVYSDTFIFSNTQYGTSPFNTAIPQPGSDDPPLVFLWGCSKNTDQYCLDLAFNGTPTATAAAIPEPTSLVLVGLGLLAIPLTRRLLRRKA